ncbi:hypothetical protein B5C34_10540 [Pacificimonas flava]|uniref:Fluoride-specific ion channel FluC n=2 Tax=Pacificimonas TaxID=1960290 RepID=A0A219B679_9SPHN|nr:MULTISPECIES: fluoride efflux transporter CrcB [Pacificimonas]MBZ6378893.1 fluoride efflux transporter CrcB [Pacificimonas aurantium]OWV33855.1 hypothetical protein B5C34_10540 [Pacificimonas flava]
MLPIPVSHLGLIFLGGGLGAITRFLAAHWTNKLVWDGRLPWGTFTVNLIGSFLIGAVIMWTLEHASNSQTRLLLVTGFLGGFTTFSAFSFEMTELLIDRRYGAAAGYGAGSVVLCVLATFAGASLVMMLGRGAAR